MRSRELSVFNLIQRRKALMKTISSGRNSKIKLKPKRRSRQPPTMKKVINHLLNKLKNQLTVSDRRPGSGQPATVSPRIYLRSSWSLRASSLDTFLTPWQPSLPGRNLLTSRASWSATRLRRNLTSSSLLNSTVPLSTRPYPSHSMSSPAE